MFHLIQLTWLKETFVKSEEYCIERPAVFQYYEKTWKGKEGIATNVVFGHLLQAVFPDLKQKSLFKKLVVTLKLFFLN